MREAGKYHWLWNFVTSVRCTGPLEISSQRSSSLLGDRRAPPEDTQPSRAREFIASRRLPLLPAGAATAVRSLRVAEQQRGPETRPARRPIHSFHNKANGRDNCLSPSRPAGSARDLIKGPTHDTFRHDAHQRTQCGPLPTHQSKVKPTRPTLGRSPRDVRLYLLTKSWAFLNTNLTGNYLRPIK